MNLRERFMAKVLRIPESTCWIWDGYTDAKMGYGMFWMGVSMRLSHRVAHELFVAPIPDGMHVCHSCDVPSCVNPDHLWLGSNADNVADKIAKGRAKHLNGVDHPAARLNEETVRWIRASEKSGAAIARELRMDRSTINYIRKGKLWGHVK